MRTVGKGGAAAFVTAVVAVVGTATAWACVPDGVVQKLSLNPAEAKPGEEIVVNAPVNESNNPIEVRLNEVDGPLLGVIPTADNTAAQDGYFTARFSVPADAKPGQNAVIAVQEGVKWEPALLSVLDPAGAVPQVTQSPAAAKAVAPPPNNAPQRTGAAVAALALAAAAVGSTIQRRRTRDGGRAGLWRRAEPTALALAAGAAAYAALRPNLDASLLVIGVAALGAGWLGLSRGRTHFIPIGLVVGCWGAAVWLVSQEVIPRPRSSAATVTGLGLGLLLSAKLARSPQQRLEWLHTGILSAFSAGVSYYVLYDLPSAFAEWSTFTVMLLGWAAWEQFRATTSAHVRAGDAGEGTEDETGRSTPLRGDAAQGDPALAPSVR